MQDSLERVCLSKRDPEDRATLALPCERAVVQQCEFGPVATYIQFDKGAMTRLVRHCYRYGDDYDRVEDSLLFNGSWQRLSE